MEFETKHVPGPWDIKSGTIYAFSESRFKEKQPICFMADGIKKKQEMATAQLIAAAPDMLEALIRVYRHAEVRENYSFKIIVEETIKKAIGPWNE